MEGTQRIIHEASIRDIQVILNPAPAQKIPEQTLQEVDVIIPNETETQLLTGIYPEDIESCRMAAQHFFGLGVKRVIVTLGSRGSYAADGLDEAWIPIAPCGAAVDSTGAGDAFCGGFAAGLSEGMRFFEAAWFATVTAGLSVTGYGTSPSMPFRKAIDHNLEKLSKNQWINLNKQAN